MLLLITVGLNLGLAFFLFNKRPRNRITISFSLLLVLISLWGFEIAMFRASSDPESLKYLFSSFYLTAALISINFYIFCLYFPYELKRVQLATYIFIFSSSIFITLLIFYGGIATQILYDPSFNHEVRLSIFNYFLYCVFFCAYIIASFKVLIRKYRATASFNKKAILIVIIATAIAAIAGIVFDLVVPLYTYRFIWIGPYFTAVMVLILVRYLFIRNE